jgi:hypothetical protein
MERSFTLNDAIDNAVSVPINTAFRGEFLRHQVADCGAEGVTTATWDRNQSDLRPANRRQARAEA